MSTSGIDLGFAENGEKFDRHVQNYVNPSLNQDSGEVYSNGEVFESDEDLHGYVNSNIGKVRSIQSDLKTSMSVATKDNLPKGFNLVGDDIYQSGDRVGGITIGKGNSSRILIAPSAKGLYIGSVRVTTKIIVHELVHAYHISRGLRGFDAYSEFAASTYSYYYLKAHGNREAASFYLPAVKPYPKSYGWRNLPKIINPGVK